MKVCNEKGYIKNPQMTVTPNPIQIKAGATHTISISFEHLQEIVNGTKVNLELFIGNTMLPCQPLQVFHYSIYWCKYNYQIKRDIGILTLLRNTFWPKDFPDVNVGSCEYEIGELFELMKLLGFPCNDNCNLPLPAQTYRMEGGYRLDDDFDIPELVKMMLTMQSKKFIYAKAKISIKGKEVACVELKVDYSL